MNPPEDRRVITAPEAQRELGIPASSIRAWASQERLFPVSIDQRGRRWYRLADVLALRQTTNRRASHKRPARLLCAKATSDIA